MSADKDDRFGRAAFAALEELSYDLHPDHPFNLAGWRWDDLDPTTRLIFQTAAEAVVRESLRVPPPTIC